MSDNQCPVIITDDERFGRLVNGWKYVGLWDDFAIVYNGKTNVPTRLQRFTIVTSSDPDELYGALLQVTPDEAAQADGQLAYTGCKLLAKIRLN